MRHIVLISPTGYLQAEMEEVAQQLDARLSGVATSDAVCGREIDLIIWHTRAYPFDGAVYDQLKQSCQQ